KGHLNPAQKISGHPIRTGEEDLGRPGIFETVNPAMLQEPAHDADDANVFAHFRDFRAQTTDAANDEVNGYLRAGGFVKLFDNLAVDQGIELRGDASGFTRARMGDLAIDESEQSRFQIERRDQKLFEARIVSQAGEGIEDDAD